MLLCSFLPCYRDRDYDVMPILVNESGEPSDPSFTAKHPQGEKSTGRGGSGGVGASGAGGNAPLPATPSEEIQGS